MTRFLLFFATLCFALPLQAQSFDVQAFGKLPILDEGRVKPIESFARAKKKELAGSERDAVRWLITLLFDPARGESMRSLKITNPELLTLLELRKDKSKLYSYREVFDALDRKQKLVMNIVGGNEELWTPAQRELIKLQQRTITLQELLGSLSAFLPLDIDPPRRYIEMQDDVDNIKNWVQNIVRGKGDDYSRYTEKEKRLAELSFLLTSLKENGQRNKVFRVLQEDGIWRSPWEHISEGKAFESPVTYWKNLAHAYHTRDAQAWSDNLTALHDAARIERPVALHAEYYYAVYNPFFLSFIIIFVTSLTLGITYYTKYDLFALSSGLLWVSVLIQLAGIGTRIYILERPPVSTLYETVLFVCALSMLYCVLKRKDFWLWAAAGLGALLHILGFAHAQDGDTLMMLSAVLNTNFWLATHVLTITAGYAFCALTSVLAHYLLIKDDETLYHNMISCSLIALFFATIGTVLGGIWADQSWGRFWGWDPKENGALLIVLWLIWILHGRICGLLNRDSVLYGLSYLSVVLALSWFGVNLLSVGLHSYGFTDSAGLYLGAFIALESIFLVWAYLRRRPLKSLSPS